MSRTTRCPFSVSAVAVLFLGAGCGPFGYLPKVAKEANRAVEAAKAAGAERYAPYEYWGAVAYLDQAKLMMAYSEYERSFDYGGRARQLAEEAKRKTEMREAGKTSRSDPSIATPDTEVAPPEPEAEGDAAVEGPAKDAGVQSPPKAKAKGSKGGKASAGTNGSGT